MWNVLSVILLDKHHTYSYLALLITSVQLQCKFKTKQVIHTVFIKLGVAFLI